MKASDIMTRKVFTLTPGAIGSILTYSVNQRKGGTIILKYLSLFIDEAQAITNKVENKQWRPSRSDRR